MIECRGRNGWFNLHEASAYKLYEGWVAVQMRSKSPYRDMPPYILLDRERRSWLSWMS